MGIAPFSLSALASHKLASGLASCFERRQSCRSKSSSWRIPHHLVYFSILCSDLSFSRFSSSARERDLMRAELSLDAIPARPNPLGSAPGVTLNSPAIARPHRTMPSMGGSILQPQPSLAQTTMHPSHMTPASTPGSTSMTTSAPPTAQAGSQPQSGVVNGISSLSQTPSGAGGEQQQANSRARDHGRYAAIESSFMLSVSVLLPVFCCTFFCIRCRGFVRLMV